VILYLWPTGIGWHLKNTLKVGDSLDTVFPLWNHHVTNALLEEYRTKWNWEIALIINNNVAAPIPMTESFRDSGGVTLLDDAHPSS
jgi:hypothetical protein